MKQLVFFENNQALTTSLKIAEVFEKRHDHVLRTIESAKSSLPKIGAAKNAIIPATYVDAQGKTRPMYLLNRDGCTFVVMKFTGEKASAWQWQFIEAFNKMEDALKNLGAAEVQRLQIRRNGIELGRKPVTDAIQRFNVRDFKDGDKDSRARQRYARFTHETQVKSLGIPAGGRGGWSNSCGSHARREEQRGDFEPHLGDGRLLASSSRYVNRTLPTPEKPRRRAIHTPSTQGALVSDTFNKNSAKRGLSGCMCDN